MPRRLKYFTAAQRPKGNFDFEIPRDSSTRCKPNYAQAHPPAPANFRHVTRAYL
jgi:hypothetical protein